MVTRRVRVKPLEYLSDGRRVALGSVRHGTVFLRREIEIS